MARRRSSFFSSKVIVKSNPFFVRLVFEVSVSQILVSTWVTITMSLMNPTTKLILEPLDISLLESHCFESYFWWAEAHPLAMMVMSLIFQYGFGRGVSLKVPLESMRSVRLTSKH